MTIPPGTVFSFVTAGSGVTTSSCGSGVSGAGVSGAGVSGAGVSSVAVLSSEVRIMTFMISVNLKNEWTQK